MMHLGSDAASELEEHGFVVLPGMVGPERMERLITAYTEAVTSATSDDVRVGSTSTKVNDFVNRGAAFDDLYLFPPLLEACRRVIGAPFKLSSFHARTLRPGAHAQELHVDVPRDSADWPLLGFILMVDEFRPDNGNGSVWHGHTANRSNRPRRSIQGAFIPRGGYAATDFAARMQPETRARLSSLARALLALPAV